MKREKRETKEIQEQQGRVGRKDLRAREDQQDRRVRQDQQDRKDRQEHKDRKGRRGRKAKKATRDRRENRVHLENRAIRDHRDQKVIRVQKETQEHQGQRERYQSGPLQQRQEKRHQRKLRTAEQIRAQTTAGETASAKVTNSGTDTGAELNFSFTLPRGEKGDPGPQGEPGPKGDAGQVPAKTGDANDLSYTTINFFKGKFTADISVAEIKGSSFLATTAQNIDVHINDLSFIIPVNGDEKVTDGEVLLNTKVLLNTTVPAIFYYNGIIYRLQVIATYNPIEKEFYINLPNPDVRIRTLDDGETGVCIAQITKFTYTDSTGISESITDLDQSLYITQSELGDIEEILFAHSHTIST